MLMEMQEISWNKGIQTQIEKGDLQGIDLREYAVSGYDSNVLKQIRFAKLAGIELEEYVKRGFDGEQLREIRVALQQGIALGSFLDEGFCAAQLRQIRKGLRSFVNVRVYADTCYNWLQMKELRIGLQSRVDVSVYANPLFSSGQMKEIRLGLEEGIDVRFYASLLYSRTDMEQKRRSLVGLLYEEGKRRDVTVVDEGTGLEILLSDNRLKAYITFPKEHRKLHLTVDYIEQILRRNGVVYGILRENIAHAIEEKRFDEKILVAEGTKPETGADGSYRFFFQTEPSRKPMELDDGKVDYRNVDIFQEVMENQPVARYIPAQKGASGTSVGGLEIPGKVGKELAVLQGKGIRLHEDGVTYVAALPGIIEYKNDEITIYEALVIREDVNAAYGNINFHGCVQIYGNVGPNVEIMAEGSISVEGTVEASGIFSKGDVLLKNGMVGAGKGNIRAMGNIAGNFFESATLWAGHNIEAGYLMNTEAEAGNKVVMMGRRGAIIGGRTRSVYGMEANHIGNRSQLATIVETGAGPESAVQLQKCQEQLEMLQKDILDITTRMGRFKGAEKQSMTYKKLQSEQNMLRERAAELQKQRKSIQDLLQSNHEIQVLSKAYAGTKIVINQITKQLKEDYRMVTFGVENQEIITK